MTRLADVFRWLARLSSVVALLFVLVFAAGEGLPLYGLNASEGVYLTLFLVVLLANLASWRWERAGASVALLGLFGLILVEAAAGGRLPGAWFFALVGIPAVCFLLASTLGHRRSTNAQA
jgi:hypothetical protein